MNHIRPDVSPLAWPLQDRVQFLPWIKATFDYPDDAPPGQEGRSLFSQQKFVRDYLQHSSPYRGLLLLHSLGVGKTCAAIAAAEALRPSRKGGVFVMTTKMLHSSFASEVPKCGAPDLMRRQKWLRLPASDPRVAAAAEKLTRRMLKDHDGVWVPETEEGTEYDELDATSQAHIDSQIDAIISATFHFIHYNGLTKQRIDLMVNGGTNPFDGAVVIIDEVHNFISRVMNKRLVSPLYERLLDAVDCKVLLLSGTPIVNQTAELAYIVNLVQGRTLVHDLQLMTETTIEELQETLDAANLSRFVQEVSFDPSTKTMRLVFMPTGFEQSLVEPDLVQRTDEAHPTIDTIVQVLGKADLRVRARKVYTALPLPEDPDVFDRSFVDWAQGQVLNPMLLQRRIVGAVSSYNRRDKELFASVSPISIVQAEMSGLQFVKYAQLRYEERRRERNVQRLQVRANGAKRQGETDNLGQVYRTFTLALCTFAFPDEITRPFKFQMRQKLREDLDAEIDSAELDREYERTMELATRRLKVEMPDTLQLDGSLAQHSPKFMALLQRVKTTPGPALIYSQFRYPFMIT
ncbi:putative ATP-dependent RNA [Tetrabaena socialis]|uniref:Putative ATP-dependent RNA n=1 Tax=Tetrabaena socialis TaxID=47790 RepID=A0A2J7ZRC3_9CHLO|nr:putative ATP-dependent RNA [Tetrabaena socialis]|eukprot:PNH02808.1 putative ATP-dependent RNA [Tetrabaena socialis]